MVEARRKKEWAETPLQLDAYAEDQLRFIRKTMERSGSFTGISGKACIVMGLLALLGSYIASLRLTQDWWVWSWTGVATLACLCGIIGMLLKAKRLQLPIWAGAGKHFLLGFSPPIISGMILTEIFFRAYLDDRMPGLWLLLYGVAILAGGAFSIRVIPLFGMAFFLLGAFLLLFPVSNTAPVVFTMTVQDLILGLVFGLMHIFFGLIIIGKYGA